MAIPTTSTPNCRLEWKNFISSNKYFETFFLGGQGHHEIQGTVSIANEFVLYLMKLVGAAAPGPSGCPPLCMSTLLLIYV